MKFSTKLILAIAIGLCLGILVNGQQPSAPPLPPRDTVIVDDLKMMLSDCTINANAEVRYEAKLVARIRELEKQLAEANLHIERLTTTQGQTNPIPVTLPKESKAK